MTTAQTVLEPAARRLAEAGVASPRHDAEALLAHLLGVPRSRLAWSSVDLSPDQERRYDELVGRRADREPLQHLTGTAPFRYLELQVGPGVFVPRPETEVVVDWAIGALAGFTGTPVVVDLCTGSGAIAGSIAGEVPGTRVYAVELDPDAHAWAERNLAGTDVTLARGDAATAFPDLDGTVDLVIANPPYIPLEAYESVEREVRDHDPALALWSGPDGLDAIRVVERAAARLLRPGGAVVVEHADVQGESAPAVFAGTGRWDRVRDHLDLAGRHRFVTAWRVAR
ncbi:release factor glutamine methyltransferase [Actinopolymorpha cephalotaxi]|uniref:Release factor glutamine methyltransferase n=1 Tax=Actinopolymorpha cephalotaxi TaxID=504797 RepID=A0A1I2ZD59_9ACTN|nr:peptide chain release factor N(5)-glutamine methyltransferase [Actinopolymorpha cephalotaxi]NYH81922.1 release factor glutamine methyltransferase [Actinopolymorpha cephalotaxi]SFH35792.1 release factor glutamine methyltransferase [Actinopolymorpha cephalotaxi]